ncbi:MAG: protein of unknown function, family [Noviherbaspirillum sp.]|jgi:hypothetical protein|nr:protein of unknown function, family [Noviherbaspirillum sp.]
MTVSMYAASIPVFSQMLKALKDVLNKAEAHAAAKKIEPDALLQARLFPDMLPLLRQVQIATDFAKGVSLRLAGADVPAYEDNEKSFADLQSRLDKTLALLGQLSPSQIDGSETREIVLRPGTPKEQRFNGQDYLLKFAVPQFFFHVTTAYAILRHNGVEIGKKDYMGAY